MPNDTPLPFDALRPFKSKPEEFTPRDTLPWESHAEQFLRYRTEEGFMGLRSFQQVETDVTWLIQNLNLPPAATILDIGCGPGLYSNHLAGAGYDVTGIDIAQPFLDYAQAEAQTQGVANACVYRRLSMFDLDYQAEFEAVLLIQSIANRITLAELQELLTKIRTALKPGGHFIIEFQVAPPNFASTESSVTESISFLAQSPWSDQFHAWMIRDLIFPATSERVNHHLILGPDGQPVEYWSRFKLYAIPTLTDLLSDAGFQVQTVFGKTLGRPYQATDESCFIWARRRDQGVRSRE
jgi:SAM-dependent methyltransferase